MPTTDERLATLEERTNCLPRIDAAVQEIRREQERAAAELRNASDAHAHCNARELPSDLATRVSALEAAYWKAVGGLSVLMAVLTVIQRFWR